MENERDNMGTLEKDLKEMKDALKRIENALGIGPVTPAKVVDLNRRAMQSAEKIREKLSHVGTPKGK